MEAIVTFVGTDEGIAATKIMRVELDVPTDELCILGDGDTDALLDLLFCTQGGHVVAAEWLSG